MSNDYLDSLQAELEKEGVMPPTSLGNQNVIKADDRELKIILDMEKITGVKYSDEQRKILEHHGNACILACAGSGKALANGTGVLTPNGYVPIESLKVGDKVYDHEGKEQIVLGVYPQGKKKVYKVKFIDRAEIKCCSEHLWAYYDKDKTERVWRVGNTEEIMLKTLYGHKVFVPMNRNIVNEDIYSGLCNINRIINLLESNDEKKYAELLSELTGFEIEPLDSLYVPEKIKNKHDGFWSEIYRLFNKSFHSKKLVEDIRDIALMNGNLCKVVQSTSSKWKVVRVNTTIIPSYCIGTELCGGRQIVKIEETDEYEEMTCIKVSGLSELFLTEHCIVTHNTTISTHLIAKRILSGEIKDVNRMIYTTYSKAGATEMKERLDKLLKKLNITKDVQVRTLHSFFLQVLRTFGVNANIIKDSLRSQFIREACKDADFSPRDDDLMLIDNLLSYQVNNLLSDKKTIESYVNTLDNLTLEQYTKIRSGYATRKAAKGLIDYDDMQSYLYSWLVKMAKSSKPEEVATAEAVRNYCKAMWTDFYIDEAQDVSKIQFAIIRAMVTDPNDKNKLTAGLVFIGDDDQCLVEGTKVITEEGEKNIEDIQYMDTIESCIGNGEHKLISVDNGHKKEYHGDIVVITTESGNVIKGTPNHIGFARIVPNEYEHYTYLMYRHDFGFRIGTTSGVRAGIRKGIVNGVDMRLMQERADKIWILKVFDNEHDAKYWEALLAYKYSIPMYRFVASDSGKGLPVTSLDTNDIKCIHTELDTFNNGIRLLNDFGMDYKYPHRVPQAEEDRCRITFSMLSSGQTNKNGIHKSEVSVNSSNMDYINITSKYLKTCERKSDTKYNYFNSRLTTNAIDLSLKNVDNILDECKNDSIYVEPSYSAKLTKDNKFLFMPLGNMIKGMVLASCINGCIVDDKIVSIDREHYDGYVYDLSLPETRNLIANNVVVHNCIYTWRGSDPSIILTCGTTFNMSVFKLTTNYRCYNEIVDYASNGVKYNNNRYEKDMNAFDKGGNVKIAISEKEDLCNLSIIALNHIKWMISHGEKVGDIAVLARNNFHLAILSNMLLREGIYCNMTEDMKLTKSYMYRDVKMLIDLCSPNYSHDTTNKIIWKLCRYMGNNNAHAISSFQNNSGLSFEDTIGFIVKKFIDRDIQFNKTLYVSMQEEQKIAHYINGMSSDTKADISMIYKAITCGNKTECFSALAYLYGQSASFLYKSKDKSRSINGLLTYIRNLIMKDGYDKMIDFLRVTEQLEGGNMVIPGEKLTLTTIHSAKGREWKNVIMFACDNVTSPSFDGIVSMLKDDISIHDISENLSEERRLFYVGNTRAKENLLTITYKTPSIFILEALGVVDNTENNNYNIISFAQDNNWFEVYKDKAYSEILNVNSKYYYDIEAHKA